MAKAQHHLWGHTEQQQHGDGTTRTDGKINGQMDKDLIFPKSKRETFGFTSQ